ncbi:M3 family metallopeptidase [Limnohabitans sp. 103DPR2]|uniref:M3 family metallopeptidase n=1 Tax=Limnohabitans sp. 103DPR2 TaxID=1678129 RepID=UPI0006DC319C|nr:M3 family metallopeptidase [Limnohabitans sp. 103DPR2]ALK92139.1 Peptidyl-dipeptidase dcp [Limnohabitans sp. 103DPR2]
MTNPLLQTWQTPFGMPPFESIQASHFEEAFDKALLQHQAEIAAISNNSEPPTFENTLIALEASGDLLNQTSNVFFNLSASHSSPDIQSLERNLAPKLAAHSAALYLNAALFQRIDALNQTKHQLQLDAECIRLIERYHLDFVRAGAKLQAKDRESFAQNSEKLASLFTQFSQNVLADESSFCLTLTKDEELQGLPSFVRQSAQKLAKDRGLTEPNAHAFTLSRSSITPFMTFSERRDLRKTMWNAWCQRGEHAGAHNNEPIMKEILKLRLAQARLLGYKDFSEYALADTMAGSAQQARDLLMRVWQPARLKALQEREDLKKLSGLNDLEAWDWHFWTERVRKEKFDLNEAEIKPYLQLHKLMQAMFHVANRLFGVNFKEVSNIAKYHDTVTGWEVTDANGQHVGLFLSDNFARSTKRSGAWMSTYRDPMHLSTSIRPIVVNNNNFSQGPEGQPTLLSLDDARTLFHEFGHGLHGLLSQVRFPRLSGTSVLRDFVEFPSQVYENWLMQPQILKEFALHAETGQAMPDDLIQKILDAQTFNQGFSTVEYVSSALVDLALHETTDLDSLNFKDFEARTLKAIDMPPAIGMRHRLPHFSHLFSSNSYASAYYVYMWAEVLDADGFDAFLEAGDLFAPEPAHKLYEHIYSAGNKQDPMQAYIAFRGRAPTVTPLLTKRGLA